MCLRMLYFLTFLLTIHSSLPVPENTPSMEFEGRWVTKPPFDTEFTYAVVIKDGQGVRGSGSLITLDWVLTAARCVLSEDMKLVDKNKLSIYAGVDKNINDTDHVQMANVAEVKLNGEIGYFGLALMKLDKKFESIKNGKSVNPLELSGITGFEFKLDPACLIGSFGKIKVNESSPVLKTDVKIIEECNCSDSLKQAFPHVSVEQWVCTDDRQNVALCKGDLGAALRCPKSVGVAVGVFTFKAGTCDINKKLGSAQCGMEPSVSVYRSVCHQLGWIHKETKVVAANSTPCDEPDSSTSIHRARSVNGLIYFWLLYIVLIVVSRVFM